MDAKTLADKLHGVEYPFSLTKEDLTIAKDSGLVVVYGASDDLMELEGAVNDEVGACNGGTAIIDAKGVLPDWEQLMDDSPSKDEVREYFEREKQSAEIEAIWNSEGYSFTYKTKIPHFTFDVLEDGDPYCRGIVFSLTDIPSRDSV